MSSFLLIHWDVSFCRAIVCLPTSCTIHANAHLLLRGRLVLAQPVNVVAEVADLVVRVAEPTRLVGAPRRVGLKSQQV